MTWFFFNRLFFFFFHDIFFDIAIQIFTVGGLLNATFGNVTELIISIFALKNGMIRVVQLTLLGSILSNMLLVLGCAFFCGGLVFYQKDQVFDKVINLIQLLHCILFWHLFSCIQGIAVVNSGLLLMAVMGILFPAVLHYTHSEVHAGSSEMALSRFSSCIMLIAYAAYLFFQLKSQSNSYSPLEEVCCFFHSLYIKPIGLCNSICCEH